jgi:hypothetical protein
VDHGRRSLLDAPHVYLPHFHLCTNCCPFVFGFAILSLSQPRQPYVFDGSILHREGAAAVADFSFPPVFRKESADRQIIAGPPLSGAMMHFHGAAVNMLFVGVKLWVFFPPAYASFIDAHAADFWSAYFLPNYGPDSNKNVTTAAALPPWSMVAVQGPGDLIFVPHHVGHAVLNLADTFALAYE